MKIKFFSLFLLLLCAGCMLNKKCEDPQVAIQKNYLEQQEDKNLIEISAWWENWNDPILCQMVKIALSNNYDLKIALERVLEMRALYQLEKSKLFPEVDILALAERQKISKTIISYFSQGFNTMYQIGFDASWEIDLFGKIQYGVNASVAEVQSQIEKARDVRVTLLAEVGKEYIQAITYKKKIALTEDLINSQKQVVCLMKDKFQSGLVSEKEYLDSKSLLQQYESGLAPLIGNYKSSSYRLCYLLGKPMEYSKDLLLKVDDFPQFEKFLPNDLPSDLLLRRPDIREALSNFKKSFFQKKEAGAELFPRFSILGGFGYQADKPSNLWLSDSQFWTLLPQVRWPFLDFGRIRSNISAKTHAEKQALLTYENVVLKAFQDVETSFVSFFQKQKEVLSLKDRTVSLYKRSELQKNLFETGLSDLSLSLQLEQTALQAKIDEFEGVKQQYLDLIALYKSLGGGW